MAFPDYKDKPEETYQYDLDDWTIICQYCLRPVSATRPPVYNEVNCGCSELGTHAVETGQAMQPDAELLGPRITVYEQPASTYQHSIPEYVSYTPTSTPHEELLVYEISNNFQNININWSDGNLNNGTKITQNQPCSIQSYSWPLHSWLKENESSYPLSSTPQNPSHVHKSSSIKAKKGSKRGNSSLHSFGSSVELGFKGWGPEPCVETGAWVGKDYQEPYDYQLALSIMSDSFEK